MFVEDNKHYEAVNHIDIIKHYESLHDGDLKVGGLQPKVCPAGYITAGWGRVLTSKTGKMLMNTEYDWTIARKIAGTITEATADAWLRDDLAEFESKVRSMVTVKLEPHQIGALVSFTYNVGLGNFRTSTMLKLINSGKLNEVYPQFLRWVNAGGRLLGGLVCRRQTEADYWSTGLVVFYKWVNGKAVRI